MGYTFQIPIKPQVKQRPRFGRHVFTPKKTRDFEKALSFYFQKVKSPLKHALKVEITFTFQRPKKPSHDYPSRGDLDNYVKAVLDAMNGLVFDDDSQIVKLSAEKKWGEEDLIIAKVAEYSGGA